jgi:ABC-type transporter Mla subunit MlaD
MTTTTRTSDNAGSEAKDRLASTAQQAADTVAGVAGDMTARLPDAANSTREALAEANRMVRSGSDETLKIVGALSLGFGGGLLVGGANRLLVIVALAPAVFVGSALIERMNAAGTGRTGGSAKSVQRG